MTEIGIGEIKLYISFLVLALLLITPIVRKVIKVENYKIKNTHGEEI